MNTYDPGQLLKDYYQFVALCGRQTPINLKKPTAMTDQQGLDYGAESLYDYTTNTYTKRQEDYDATMDFIQDTYTQSVIEQMTEDIGHQHHYDIGRVRFLALKPKQCLTMHIDTESETRFHIPIQTNRGALFIVDNTIVTMWDIGKVYQLDVQKPHTAINASREIRVHMVFDAYSN